VDKTGCEPATDEPPANEARHSASRPAAAFGELAGIVEEASVRVETEFGDAGLAR
jgi:hypothetical protein